MKTRILSGVAALRARLDRARRARPTPATRSASSAPRPSIRSPPPSPSSSARPAPSRPRSSNRPAPAAASSCSAPASATTTPTSPTPRAPSRRASSRLAPRTASTDIVELKIGFDGLVIANSKAGPDLKLTKTQIFLALAKEVPGADGKLVANPYKNWSDIDPSLPGREDRSPRPAADLRHARRLPRARHGSGRRARSSRSPRSRKADAKAFERSGSRSARTAPISTPARTTT